jgi:hypothetical protein
VSLNQLSKRGKQAQNEVGEAYTVFGYEVEEERRGNLSAKGALGGGP